jgi:hypothetical protein
MVSHKLVVVLTSNNSVEVTGPRHANGWGPDGEFVAVEGEVAEIRVERAGESECSIRIQDDGSLVITNYRGGYEMRAPQRLHLRNTRPWPKPGKTD